MDYQNDFIDGALGFEKSKTLKQNILKRLNGLNFNDTDLLITYDTHGERIIYGQRKA